MSRPGIARAAALIAGGLFLAHTGSAYYYYIYYNSTSAPYIPIPAKFDLNALTNKTLPFLVSNQGPALMAAGDTYQAIVSEIRAAAEVWNDVASSDLRLAYGGLFTVGTTESAPGIDVAFSDEIPPGLLALGGPEYFGSLTTGANGTFIPITRSLLRLPSDMSTAPSYSELFFVTLVHEFGHTLGLQHSLASSVMSTLWTSASTKATPLGADDIAGISLLYPAANYLSTVGSISGQVTMSGAGVNLASVVALSASNPAITALTNPDGTYEIDGVPPGQYFVYVHPLPPPLQGEGSRDNIYYPQDAAFNYLLPNYVAFGTQFYPGTQDQLQARPITVSAGKITSGINLNVNPLNSVAVSSVRTYGFTQTNVAVASPPLARGTQGAIEATGAGLLQANNVVTPGLSVGLLGSAALISNLRPYPPPVPYIAMDVLVNFAAGQGPKHLLFYTPGDLYVLPAGFTVVYNSPPAVSSAAPTLDAAGNRAVVISGSGFQSDTRILFDGLPGAVESRQADGSLLVLPPPGPGSYAAAVAALNSDGQSSLFFSPTPPTYTYDPAGAPSLTVAPRSLSPGADITMDVQGVNTNFIAGQTLAGFGTSDVLVKQVNVLSPTHLTAVVTPGVSVSTSGINVTTGLEIISQALGNPITVTDLPHQ